MTPQMISDMAWQAVNMITFFLFSGWFGWQNKERITQFHKVTMVGMVFYFVLVMLFHFLRFRDQMNEMMTDRVSESLALVVYIAWGVWISMQEDDAWFWRCMRYLGND